MFFHIFKYQLKLRLKDKIGIFWALAFPIILAILFNLAFSNILASENFEKIPVAILNNYEEKTNFQSALEKSDLFKVESLDKSTAEALLASNEISAYISGGDEISITLSKSGINQSIIKEFVDIYIQRLSTIENIITTNSQGLQGSFIDELDSLQIYTNEKPLGNSTNVIVIFFYTLIAMVSLLGSNFGCDDVINIQGNQSPRAARVNVAPKDKLQIFFPALCATMTYHFSIVTIYIFFINKVLNIDFGKSLGPVILLVFVACFTGISMGTMLSSLIKKGQTFKTALNLVITMGGSFLAGMMAVQIKYYVQKYVPIISYINPANLITDGLYSLYYYDSFHRYFLNLGILSSLGIVFTIVTYLVLRRQQYASI